MKQTGLVISSFMMGLLNANPLASDPRGPAWLEQSIDAAKDLGAKVILVAFFGKGSLLEGDQTEAGRRGHGGRAIEGCRAAGEASRRDPGHREHAVRQAEHRDPRSHRTGFRRASTTTWATRRRRATTCPPKSACSRTASPCFHFKDGPKYLGEGNVKFEPIAAAIKDIGYQGWIVMETSNPSKEAVADAKRNAAYIRELLG